MVKRKINRVGNSTLTVSLPSKWVKYYGLKQGDEIELEEKGDSLTIFSKKGRIVPSVIHIDARDFETLSQLRRNIAQAYRTGAETIEVEYINRTEFHERTQRLISFKEDIEKQVNSELLGMEMEKSTPNLFIIKQFGEAIEEEFDSAVRKIFYKLQDLVDQAIASLKTMDSDQIKSVWASDRGINKFCNFCMRILNKRGSDNLKSGHELYALLVQLELIGDMIYMIPMYSDKMKIKKIDPEIFSYLTDVKTSIGLALSYFIEKKETYFNDFKVLREKLEEYEKKCFKKDGFYSNMIGKIWFMFELIENLRDVSLG